MTILAELGERNVIEEIVKTVGTRVSTGEVLSYPDDAKDLLPKAPRLIVNVDGYGIDKLRLPWRDSSDIGWCAITGSVSDVIAKGGFPDAVLIALGLPPDYPLEELRKLAEGVKDAIDYYKVRLVGGDTNSSSEPWIAVTTIGFTPAKKPPARKGLRVNDYVVVTGIYGAMGFAAIKGIEEAGRRHWVVERTKRPVAVKDLSVVISSNYRWITASMDVSDGLGYTLQTLSIESDARILLTQPPLYEPSLIDECHGGMECVVKTAMSGGEEYGVVLGIRPEGLNNVVKDLEYYNIPFRVVGRVVDGGPGVFYGDKPLEFASWDQFKGWG
ncbi:MAG: thiamine-phosphate kinase [Thermosphaera aggregans]|jgi:thiamine-monophosphate kinase|uniref:thiamine-phosphate kinase n=1 Tax=Thermosphaera aggregans TaxID=54254 RepID=UPI003BFFF1D2